MTEIEYCIFLKTWGTVVGLGFDIMGAILVWFGVRVSIEKANALEQVSMPELIGDIGSTDNLSKKIGSYLHRELKKE